MSISYAEQLLQRYNAQKPTTTTVENEPSDGIRLGTWSYANTYDALYDKYSRDKNFNLDMWHESIKRGEQDAFLGFLEQNKDTDMSLEYYDPAYYDYESRMLELYKGQADDTTKTERFTEIYDVNKNEWVKQSLGEMTEKQYIQYQLDNVYAQKREELAAQKEREEKEQLGFWKKLGADAAATLGELGEGLLSALVGVVDIVAAPIFATGGAIAGYGRWDDMFMNYFSDYSLTSMEQAGVRAALDEFENKYTHFRDVDGNMTGVGKYVAGIANSIGKMVPSIVLTAVGAPGWLSTGVFYSGLFSSNAYENATNPYLSSPSWLKIINAGLKTAAEVVIEKTLAKFMGGTIQNKLMGIGGKVAATASLSGVKYVAKSAAQEGLEEFLQDFGTNVIDQFMGLIDEGYANNGVTFQTLIDSFLVGALSSIVLSGASVASSSIRSAAINHRAKIEGTYDTEHKLGPGDLAIEKDGKIQKLRGFKKLQFSAMISDFQAALEELQDSKLKTGEGIKLAQEVYGAIKIFSQYYSSFDAERIAACERLLNRVIEAEQETDVQMFREQNVVGDDLLSDKEISKIIKKNKAVKENFNERRQIYRTAWVTGITSTFNDMVYGAPARLAARVKDAASATSDEAKEAGVKKIYAGVEPDGTVHKNSKIIEHAEKVITRKVEDALDKFRRDPDYEFIFVTDGRDAFESDGILFVPVGWLENYTTSEIYKTLDTSKVLDTIVDDPQLADLSKDVLKFVREFTKQPTMTMKDAYMQLMFNESVYQAFLLSGENGYKHQRVVYRLVQHVNNIAKGSGYLLKGGSATPRTLNKYLRELDELVDEKISSKVVKGKYEDILQELIDLAKQDRYKTNKELSALIITVQNNYERSVKYKKTTKEFISKLRTDIKAVFKNNKTTEISDYKKERLKAVTDAMIKAMRPGTLKAIVNWGFDPQLIGAQVILNDKDKQFIQAYKTRREVLRGGGTRSAYKHLEEQLMPYIPEKFQEIVQRGLDAPADSPDRLQAIAILDWTDHYDGWAIDFNNEALLRDAVFMYNDLLKHDTLNEDMFIRFLGFLEDLPRDILPRTLLYKISQLSLNALPHSIRGAIETHESIYFDITYGLIIARLNNIANSRENTKEREYYSHLASQLENAEVDEQQAVLTKTLNTLQSVLDEEARKPIDISLLKETYTECIEVLKTVKSKNLSASKGLGAITIPYEAAALFDTEDEATVQFVSDRLHEFEELYGDYQMVADNLVEVSFTGKGANLFNAMLDRGMFDRPTFVERTLEDMLGDDYVVTRASEPTAHNINGTAYKSTPIIIAKKIPATKVLPRAFLDMDIETRDNIFKQLYEAKLDAHNKRLEQHISKLRQLFDDAIYEAKDDGTIDEDTLDELSMGIRDDEDLVAAYESIKNGIDPVTGEVFYDTTRGILNKTLYEFYYDIRYSNITFGGPTVSLKEFILTSEFSTPVSQYLNDIEVKLSPPIPGEAGHFSAYNNEIVIVKDQSDLYEILVHEMNHALQHYFNMPNGFSPELASRMPDLMQYVLNNYRDFVNFLLYKRRLVELPTGTVDLYTLSMAHRKALSTAVYALIQGEVLARSDVGNKRSHSFKHIETKNGDFVIAPDSTEFRINYSSSSSISMSAREPELPEPVAENALVRSMINVLEARSKNDTTDSYHTTLSRVNADDILDDILSDEVSPMLRTFVTLDQVIRDPDSFLNDDIMRIIGRRFDEEGYVYSVLKTYVESHYKGISIDRTGDTHQYVFVDDNAFDDLLLSTTKKLAESDTTSLYEQYHQKGIPLSTFYKQSELNRLGISNEVKVFISPNVNTEFIVDKNNKFGLINIRASEKTTDSIIIDKLNHEFRHVLQVYNNLETGFTTDIEVTTDMIKDVKKHVPELFTDERVKTFVKSMAGDASDTNIVRHFIYTLVGGELNAYGIKANTVESKPIYATQDGNNLTIFMPWYDAKTREGQYDTKYKNGGLPAELMPQGKKKKKSTEKKSRAVSKKTAGDTNLKYFIKEGKRTQIDPDLQDFIVMTTGFEDQLPKPILEAIKKGYLTKQSLFKWFRQVDINDINEFTFDLMNKCFFHNDHITSAKDLERLVSDEVVDLGNGKSIIIGPAFYWAAAAALRETGLGLEYIAMQNDLDYFLEYISTFAGTQLRTKIIHNMEKFYHTHIQTRAGDNGWQEVEFDYGSSVAHGYTRLTAMRYFDGSLGGAFLMANSVRETLKSLWISKNSKQGSTDESFDKDDDERTVTDTLDAAFFQKEYNEIEDADALFKFTKRFVRKTEAEPSVGNDIIMAYELTHKPSRIKMIDFISAAAQRLQASNAVRELAKTETISKTTAVRIFEALLLGADELKKRATDIEVEYENLNPKLDATVKKKPNWEENWKRVRKEFNFYKLVEKAWNIYETSRVVYQKKLEQARDEALYDRYLKIYTENDIGVPSNKYTIEIDGKTLKTDRNSIQNRINQHHKYITEQLKNDVIKITQLPDDVRNMFDEKTFEFNKEYGHVGRGKTATGKASGGTTYETYNAKHNILSDTAEFQHDVTEILRVEQRLRDVKFAIVQELKTRKENFVESSAAQKKANKAAKHAEEALLKQIQENQLLKAKLGEAEEKLKHSYRVVVKPTEKKKKKKSSRTQYKKTENTKAKPIVIRSDIKVPDALADIFDTTFEYMTDTLVQFASRDEKGNLYTKDDKDFNSRLKHEVTSWDAFYEANADTLQNLTHTDVLKIVEFFYKGIPMSIGIDQGKLNAIEIFTLGYIVDVGRRNIFGWNLSEATLNALDQLYEAKASAYGSGLNAVAQMKKIVNPFKRVQQRMLDRFNIQEEELDGLIKAVESLQNAKTDKDRAKRSADAKEQLKKIENLIIMRNSSDIPSLWERVKSYRYLSMLSSPATWARNFISNTALTGLNKFADTVGGWIFAKKDYREGQWNLHKVQVRDDVKTFIDINFLNNKLFDDLYSMQGKYEQRKEGTKVSKQKDLFVAMLTKALGEKYEVEHRFKHEWANNVSKIVNKMISDKPFIKHATSKYFGKILTLEVNAGKVDISKGLTNDVLNLFADAVLLANEDYMHKRSFMADLIDNLQAKHPAMYEMLHFWQPFLNSGFNWFKEALKYTPVGLASAIVKSHKLEQRIAKLDAERAKGRLVVSGRAQEYLVRRDFGKGVIGSILMTVGIMLALFGVIRIDEDERDKNKLYVFIGNLKMDITSIFGTSSLLAGAALVQGKWSDDVTFNDVMNIVCEQLFSEFVMRDILEQHRFDEGAFDSILVETESMLKSFVPQFIQFFVRMAQRKKVTYDPGVLGMLERFVNSFSPWQLGHKKIDPYTGEVMSKYALPIGGGLLASGFFGAKIYWTEVSEGEQLAMDVGLKKGQLTGELTINGKSYQIDDVKALNIKYGQLNKEDLAKIKSQKHRVEMPNGTYKTLSWDEMSDKQRKNVIDRTMEQNAKIAKIYMWTQVEGKKYYASDSLYAELKRLGITNNVYRGDKGFAE